MLKSKGLRWLFWAFLSLFLIACGSSSEEPADGDTDGDLPSESDGDLASEDGVDAEDGDVPEDGEEELDSETDAEPAEATPFPITERVNPFIGTGGVGFGVGSAFVGATRPFGLVKVAPDTMMENGAADFYHCSGYYYTDPYIIGFSHVHLHGTGAPDMANILFVPARGPMEAVKATPKGYRSTYRKETEISTPGYYSVTLDDPSVWVELTVTERAAHHRYTYDLTRSEPAMILMDIAHTAPGGEVLSGSISVDSVTGEIEGYSHNKNSLTGRYGGIPIYFSAKLNRPIQSFGTWKEGEMFDGVAAQEGPKTGAYILFDLGNDAIVEMQVGISYVSIDNARLNREQELPAFDFDGTRRAAKAAWDEEFSTITLTGGTEREQEIMATALYHAFMMPDIFSDYNGEYIGFDRQKHVAQDFVYYTNYSMWDTYRTEHSLLTLLRPERQRDMVISLLKMYEQGGYLPKWALGIGETNCMVGDSAAVVIADTYVKGITGFDADLALEAVLKTALNPTESGSGFSGREGILDYIQYGYLPADLHGESVSITQEYAVNDYAIARMAQAMGDTVRAAEFDARSRFYRNQWNPEVQFFMPKNADGSWKEYTSSYTSFTGDYVEGNPWQYLWLAPHDMAGLVELFGSASAMNDKLSIFFEETRDEFENNPNHGLAPYAYYWHGNEPDIHAAYLFLQTGHPELTQEWVRWISEHLYDTTPEGIAGNDDCGTLSSWYAFSAMGLYPIAGSEVYVVGSPIFTRAEVTLPGGVLVIEAPEASAENLYVQSLTFNGVAVEKPALRHSDLANGGTLRFEMGPSPSDWGSSGAF